VRFGVLALLLSVAAVTAGCGAAEQSTSAKASTPLTLTIKGKTVVDGPALQAQAEAELSYTLNFGYVARTGTKPVSCWFARTDLKSEVDSRLWCGPVQVPGTATAADWIPVPLKEVAQNDSGVQLEVQPPQVPNKGDRSQPVGKLVRTDGTETDAGKQDEGQAGPDFLAVLPDDGKQTNGDLGLADAPAAMRDDLLSATATGWGTPESWQTEQGTLKAEPGLRLHVLRLRIDRLNESDPAFQRTPWRGYLPQPSELTLEVPGKRQQLPADRLPAKSGSVFVVYTVRQDAQGPESLVLNTVSAKSVEQRVELPSGKVVGEAPAVLRRASGSAKPIDVGQRIKVGEHEGVLKVVGTTLGRQRPVKQGGQYELVTASAADKALLELRINAAGQDFPEVVGADLTKDLLVVTLPDGTPARQVGLRYDGGPFPVAVVVEVPADTRSVTFGLTAGTIGFPIVGNTAMSPLDGPVAVPLDF
jgi:hypothetical protein